MEIISSKENKKIKEARKLLTKKYRKTSYLVEGFHLLEEALKADHPVLQIFVEASKEEKLEKLLAKVGRPITAVKQSSELTGLSVNFVTPEVLKSLAESEHPQGVVAEVGFINRKVDFSGDKYLVLEHVQDPGNVGTMIRTADAAGFDGVLLLGETADPYSPKVIRAMQGSHFHLPVIKSSVTEGFKDLQKAELPILTTTLSADSVAYQTIHKERFALVMGNEGAGVSEEAVKAADILVHIEMPGQAESLNVAVAAGILMFSI